MSSVSGENNISSFTLVELLIVIAILAILAAAVVIVINPGEMLAEARDSQRVTDIRSLKDAVDLFVLDNPGVSLGTSQVISISIPDTSATCANISGLPTLPAGWSYRCVTAANLKNLDSTGWLPINLTSIKGGSPLPSLPIDPDNTAITRYYQYIPGSTSGSYELTSLLESEKQSKIAAKDGGTDPGRLETGSDISLWKAASGLQGYWPFEGIGNISDGQITGLEDISGKNNNGTASNVNGIGMAFVSGKAGTAITLDATDDYVSQPITAEWIGIHKDAMSVSIWVKSNSISSADMFFGEQSPSDQRFYIGKNSSKWDFGIATSGWGGGNVSVTSAWTHIAVTMNNGTATLYVNGQRSITKSYTVLTPTGAVSIGKLGSSNYYFNGLIDEVRIYDRSLSVSEVQAIYNANK